MCAMRPYLAFAALPPCEKILMSRYSGMASVCCALGLPQLHRERASDERKGDHRAMPAESSCFQRAIHRILKQWYTVCGRGWIPTANKNCELRNTFARQWSPRTTTLVLLLSAASLMVRSSRSRALAMCTFLFCRERSGSDAGSRAISVATQGCRCIRLPESYTPPSRKSILWVFAESVGLLAIWAHVHLHELARMHPGVNPQGTIMAWVSERQTLLSSPRRLFHPRLWVTTSAPA